MMLQARLAPFIFVVIGRSILFAVLLRSSVFFRADHACGQNILAAELAGVRVQRTMIAVYTLSCLMAGLGGVALAAFQGGASRNMASEFLVVSIAVVVMGGTSINGGSVNVTGIWGAGFLLFLISVLLNTYQVGAGMRNILTGAIVLAFLVIATRIEPSRGAKWADG